MKSIYAIAAVCIALFFVGCGSKDCGCKSQSASAEQQSVQLENSAPAEGESAEQ